jgi:uncharacterized protein YdhG (YjbR/CyaY superfamily)
MNVDKYIEQFEGETKARLLVLRELVHREVPSAQEGIMYGLIGYKLRKKPLVYFGGFAHHTGFYATPHGHEAFSDELGKYKQGKGSVQFPLDQPLPVELITKMIRFKREELTKGE